VLRWQKAQHEEPTGALELGTLVAIPRLPTDLRFGDDIQTATPVSGGELAISVQSREPIFTISVTEDQAAMIPAGTLVDVVYGESTWSATIRSTIVDDSGATRLELSAVDGGAVCGTQCSLLPPEELLTARAVAHVVPAVSGPSVPVAAITTDATGVASVRLANGTRQRIEILGSGDGVAVIEGVAEGESVVLNGMADQS